MHVSRGGPLPPCLPHTVHGGIGVCTGAPRLRCGSHLPPKHCVGLGVEPQVRPCPPIAVPLIPCVPGEYRHRRHEITPGLGIALTCRVVPDGTAHGVPKKTRGQGSAFGRHHGARHQSEHPVTNSLLYVICTPSFPTSPCLSAVTCCFVLCGSETTHTRRCTLGGGQMLQLVPHACPLTKWNIRTVVPSLDPPPRPRSHSAPP